MVYLDYNSTTPVDRRVVSSMLQALEKDYANPSSTHNAGMTVGLMVEASRGMVGMAVGMGAQDTIFTSGATEANNLALAGLSNALRRPINILAGATEHKSVIQACRSLEEGGSTLCLVPVKNGSIDLDAFRNAISDDTDVVSAMAANSETGVINPVEKIAEIAHDHGALVHCDATQAVGRIPFDAGALGIDMVTFSGHKMYGPKGCGALVATRDARRRLAPVIHGGGQENGLRSGTPNVPAIVGFGTACSMVMADSLHDSTRQRTMIAEFEDKLMSAVPGITVNGGSAERLPNTSNFRISGVPADAVVARMPSVSIATGSACSSSTLEPSHVLVAMGLDRTAADESVRVSIGLQTEKSHMDTAVAAIAEAAAAIRKMEAKMPAGAP